MNKPSNPETSSLKPTRANFLCEAEAEAEAEADAGPLSPV
jgi:hypothetical protein